MALETKIRRKPAITMTAFDHQRLSSLAEKHSDGRKLADTLLEEIDRARVVPDSKLAANVVRMGSTIRFTSDLGDDRHVTLVFPGEADIALGKVSILTPIGVALIGLSVGQSIDWIARDGRVHRLTVEAVEASVLTSEPHAKP